MHPVDSEEVVTIAEAARLLGYGRRYTRELISLGILPHHHRGRRTVIYRDDVLAYREEVKMLHMLTHKRPTGTSKLRQRGCEREQA